MSFPKFTSRCGIYIGQGVEAERVFRQAGYGLSYKNPAAEGKRSFSKIPVAIFDGMVQAIESGVKDAPGLLTDSWPSLAIVNPRFVGELAADAK